jgi:SynChlorMet cassette protein ScmD
MTNKLKNKPDIVLREEFDDWAVLFDPDTGKTCGLSPTGVFIWKQLDGTKSKDDILKAMTVVYGEDIQDEAAVDYDKFIEQLIKNKLVAT